MAVIFEKTRNEHEAMKVRNSADSLGRPPAKHIANGRHAIRLQARLPARLVFLAEADAQLSSYLKNS